MRAAIRLSDSQENGANMGKKAFGVILSIALVASAIVLPACSSSSARTSGPVGDSVPTSSAESLSAVKVDPSEKAKPEYEDPRWPTNNPTLLEVPDSERWYNAWDQAWTNCTVVGPVKKVYQAKDSYGMPIFVDIGEAYPGANRVTLVIWAESLGDLEEMLNDVAGGGAWLSVTGYLSVYNDTLQFNIDDGPISFQWWAKS